MRYMDEVSRIADQLQRAYGGDPWCGASLLEALEDVSVQQAAGHPLSAAHSIWEIVLHITAWMGAVRQRIEGEYVREPVEGDWQVVTDTSEAAWSEALARLERTTNCKEQSPN